LITPRRKLDDAPNLLLDSVQFKDNPIGF